VKGVEAEIVLTYEDEGEAEAVARAVSPDNVGAPEGLLVRTVRVGRQVRTFIQCRRGLKTFISTVDDLLACISVAEKTFLIAKGMRGK